MKYFILGALASGMLLYGISILYGVSGTLQLDELLSYSDVVGQEYFPMKETRLRVFGGSSLSWGGIGAAFTALDFEERDWVPLSGWPFSKDHMEPYYEEAVAVSQMDPDTVDHDPAGDPPADGTRWSNVLFSPPTRFGKVYRDDIERSPSVTTYLNSTVTKIELHPDGSHVDGLRIECLGGNSYRVVARRYVLAGGGIENARMLMVSTDVATAGIGNEHDLVGRYFQEHPRLHDRYRLPKGTPELTRRIQGAAGTLRFSRVVITEEIQREEKLLNYFANLSFGYSGQDAPQFDAVRRIVNASRSPWSDSPYYQDIGGGPNRVRWQDIKTVLKRPDRAFIGAFGAQFQPAFTRRWLEIQSSVEMLPRGRRPSRRRARSSRPSCSSTTRTHLASRWSSWSGASTPKKSVPIGADSRSSFVKWRGWSLGFPRIGWMIPTNGLILHWGRGITSGRPV